MPTYQDLLLAVPMEIVAQIGHNSMSVKDILALTPGRSILLDRLASSPIDILANGKIVARGEIVGIDDHFGIRITEVVSTANAIRSYPN